MLCLSHRVLQNWPLCFVGLVNAETHVLHKSLITISFVAAASVCASAHATDDGHLDNVWLNGRIITTLVNVVDWSGSGPWKPLSRVKVDSGLNNCYAQLQWGGQGSYIYDLVAYCMNGGGQWERGEYNAQLWEIDDGKQSIATDLGSLYFVQRGKRFHGFPDNYAFVGYDGSMTLTPKINSAGVVTGIGAAVNTGSVYAWDDGAQMGGTSRTGGLKLTFVRPEFVPTGAKLCAEAQTGLCQKPLLPGSGSIKK